MLETWNSAIQDSNQLTINAINDYTTLSTMFTLVNKSQVSKNQKPRAQEPEAKCADFQVFLNLSVAIPHYFLPIASAFRPIRPVCMGKRW